MIAELFEACWPLLIFLGMAYYAQTFTAPDPDQTWDEIEEQTKA